MVKVFAELFSKSDRTPRTPSRAAELIAVFAAAAARFLYCGFRYYPQLDDYIQLHNYATSSDYGELIRQEGLLASRPLAGVSDLYLWSKLWGALIVAVLILSAMWAASAVLFGAVIKRHFGVSPIFTVIYTLLPLNIEGTYWLAASTRIVAGMFFCALAIWLFELWMEKKRWWIGLLWFGAQLVSFCYYEQILVLSLTITLLCMIVRLIKGQRASLFALLSFVNAAIYFAFTSAFSGGTLSGRMEIILPVSRYYFQTFLPEIARQIGAAFIKGGVLTLFKGFVRGMGLIAADRAVIYALVTAAMAVGAFLLAFSGGKAEKNGEKTDIKTAVQGLVFAFLLALAPVTPYLIIGNPWFSLRATVPSLVGIALFADILARLAFQRRKALIPALTAAFTFAALVASASEINDYRLTYENDQTIIAAILDENYGENAGRVGILNLNPSALKEQNYFYHEHIHGVTENAWGLYGAAVAVSHDSTRKAVPDVTPLATDGFCYYVGWNRETKRIDGFDTLYWWDEENSALIRVYAEVGKVESDENGFIIKDENGNLYASVWEENGYGYIIK